MQSSLDLESVMRDAPIRLSTAAKLAFPDGTMTASGLRREIVRGWLMIERIAGKDFTTLESVERMRELCRVLAKELDSTSAPNAEIKQGDLRSEPTGSSVTVSDTSPRDALRRKLAKLKGS